MASLGMREWTYSPDGTAQVTVSETELTELIQSGQVGGEVLIWTQGQEDWVPITNSEFSSYLGDTAVCSVTGKTMLKSKMLQYGNEWVDPEQKDNFVSGLMEGKSMISSQIKGPWPYQQLEKPANFAKWLIVANAAFGFLFNFFEAFASHSMISLTEAEDPSVESTMVYAAVIAGAGFVSLMLLVPTVIFYCVWVNSLAKNCHALSDRPLSTTPGMMVGYYFIPFANFWMPLPQMKELWSITLDYRKDEAASRSIVNWWWGVWFGGALLIGIIGVVIEAIFPGNLPLMIAVAVVTSVVQAIAAYLIFQIITRLTERQIEIFEG